jgi:hypothetical protein
MNRFLPAGLEKLVGAARGADPPDAVDRGEPDLTVDSLSTMVGDAVGRTGAIRRPEP